MGEVCFESAVHARLQRLPASHLRQGPCQFFHHVAEAGLEAVGVAFEGEVLHDELLGSDDRDFNCAVDDWLYYFLDGVVDSLSNEHFEVDALALVVGVHVLADLYVLRQPRNQRKVSFVEV